MFDIYMLYVHSISNTIMLNYEAANFGFFYQKSKRLNKFLFANRYKLVIQKINYHIRVYQIVRSHSLRLSVK